MTRSGPHPARLLLIVPLPACKAGSRHHSRQMPLLPTTPPVLVQPALHMPCLAIRALKNRTGCVTLTVPASVQQDITRGRQMTDSLFQGGQQQGGTHNAILSSEDYLSQARQTLSNIEDGFYIAPLFLDKLSIHIAKNFLDLPKIKVPLILGAPPTCSCRPGHACRATSSGGLCCTVVLLPCHQCFRHMLVEGCMPYWRLSHEVLSCWGMFRYLGWQGPGQDLPGHPRLQEAGHCPHRHVCW